MKFKIIEWMYLHQKNNLVYYDPITKTRTRLYYDKVAKKKYSGKTCLVVFVDINRLKEVNDTKGHHEGTELIRTVSKMLLRIAGKDGEVCRIGGDEFVMILQYNTYVPNSIPYCSIGKSIKEEYEDMSSAVRKADERMYIQKKKLKLQRKA